MERQRIVTVPSSLLPASDSTSQAELDDLVAGIAETRAAGVPQEDTVRKLTNAGWDEAVARWAFNEMALSRGPVRFVREPSNSKGGGPADPAQGNLKPEGRPGRRSWLRRVVWPVVGLIAVGAVGFLAMLPMPTVPLTTAMERNDKSEIEAWLRWRPFGVAPVWYFATPQEELNDALGRTRIRDHNLVIDLLDHGADINSTDYIGETRLALAAGDGDEGMVALLLDRGAEIDKKGSEKGVNNRTPLLAAIVGGHEDIALKFLALGAKSEARDDYEGSSALMMSIYYGTNEVTRALLDRGVDVKVKGNNGATAASFACRVGNRELLKRLIAMGADRKGLPGVLTTVFEGVEAKYGVRPNLSHALKPKDLAGL